MRRGKTRTGGAGCCDQREGIARGGLSVVFGKRESVVSACVMNLCRLCLT